MLIKRIKVLSALLAVLVLSMALGSVSVSADMLSQTNAAADDDYLQQRALLLAKTAVSGLSEEIDPDSITVIGPYKIWYHSHQALSAGAAYAGRSLEMCCTEGEEDRYKLFFVYRDGEPFTYMTVDQNRDYELASIFGLDLNKLLSAKAYMEEQFPDEEIGYFQNSGAVLVFTPDRTNGHLLLGGYHAGYNEEERSLVRTRDFAIGEYEYYQKLYQMLEESGLTVHEFKAQAPIGGLPDYHIDLINGKTYPVWKFWLPRIGIPAAVVLILAGTAIFIVRRRKKKAE